MLIGKKIIQMILLAAIFAFGSFSFADISLAQTPPDPDAGKLIVNFSPDPLFNSLNFMPGDSRTGKVEVINNTIETKRVAAEAINFPKDILGFVPSDDISHALAIIIREESGSDIYGGTTGLKTLLDFYNRREGYLSSISAGSSKTYEFIISFPEDNGDQWQKKSTRFDIIVGVQGEDGGVEYCNDNGISDNGETGIDCGGGGCSACSGINGTDIESLLPPGLMIRSEGASEITGSSAVIIWYTSYNATSQVIYCRDDEGCVFDFNDNSANPPMYGYLHSTAEINTPANTNGVTYHVMTLTGLESGKTYVYRTISHASPPSISRAYSFTTLGEKEMIVKANEEVRKDQIALDQPDKSVSEENIQPGGSSETISAQEISAESILESIGDKKASEKIEDGIATEEKETIKNSYEEITQNTGDGFSDYSSILLNVVMVIAGGTTLAAIVYFGNRSK